MPDTPISMQFDGALSNVSVQYQNGEYIADQVIPPTPAAQKKGTYKVYDKAERFTIPPTIVGPKSIPNEVDWNATDDNFLCKDYGLEEFVSNEDIDNASAPIQPMADAAEFVTNLMLLDKEKQVADAVFLAANYATANKIDIAGAWTTLTTDVVAQLHTGIRACFARPNVLVMGIDTWLKFMRNEKVIAFIKGSLNDQSVSKEEVAKAFGLQKVFVGEARYNSAKKGQTLTDAMVWDGTNAGKGGAALLRVAQPTLRDVVSFSHFHWKKRQAFTYPSVRGAYAGKIVRVVETRVMKTVATDVGYLFQDCLVT